MEELNNQILEKLNNIHEMTIELKEEALNIQQKLNHQETKMNQIQEHCEDLNENLNRTTKSINKILSSQMIQGISYGITLTCVGMGGVGLVIGSPLLMATSLISIPVVLGVKMMS